MKSQGEIVFDRRLTAGDDVILECCARAQELEAAGDYEAARNVLAARWRGTGHRPLLDGLGQRAAAELLLRAGVLTGWLGSSQQLPGAQEAAKDLINEALRIFEGLDERSRVAESHIELALCYWREGAFDEGRVTLRESLALLGDSDRELRARALLRGVTIERSAGRLSTALEMLADEDGLFGSLGDHYLSGCFHNMRGLTYNNLLEGGAVGDYADRALVEFAAASYHFEQSGHARYQARVEGNYGKLLLAMGRPAEAHEHLSYARGLFAGLRDRGTAAQVDETRARTFIAEGRFDMAVQIIERALAVLEEGGERAHLAEALTTAGVALARIRRFDEAKSSLMRAVEVAETAGATQRAANAALSLLEELHHQLSPKEVCDAYETANRLAGADAVTEMLLRMRDCASLLPDLVRRLLTAEVPCDLNEKVRLLERQHIEEALNASGGRITGAARLLGFKHPQFLTSIMKSRHQDLLDARRPPVSRRRSLMKPRSKH